MEQSKKYLGHVESSLQTSTRRRVTMNDDLTGLSPPFIPGRNKRSFSSCGCWNGALLVGVHSLEGRGWFGYRLAAFIVSRRQKRWDEISMNKPRTQRNSNLKDSIVTKLPQLYYSENWFSWLNQTEKSLQSFYSNSGYISYTCTWDNNISHIFNNIWCTNSTVKWSFKSFMEISRWKSFAS